MCPKSLPARQASMGAAAQNKADEKATSGRLPQPAPLAATILSYRLRNQPAQLIVQSHQRNAGTAPITGTGPPPTPS